MLEEVRYLRRSKVLDYGKFAVRSRPRQRGSVAGRAEKPMGPGIDSPAQQFSLDVRIPVILDLVVRPPGQSCCNNRPPAQIDRRIDISSVDN